MYSFIVRNIFVNIKYMLNIYILYNLRTICILYTITQEHKIRSLDNLSPLELYTIRSTYIFKKEKQTFATPHIFLVFKRTIKSDCIIYFCTRYVDQKTLSQVACGRKVVKSLETISGLFFSTQINKYISLHKIHIYQSFAHIIINL